MNEKYCQASTFKDSNIILLLHIILKIRKIIIFLVFSSSLFIIMKLNTWLSLKLVIGYLMAFLIKNAKNTFLNRKFLKTDIYMIVITSLIMVLCFS